MTWSWFDILFSDLSTSKVRPAVVVHAPHSARDCFIVPLTSRTSRLSDGEFILADWNAAGLHVPSAVKRGIYTMHPALIIKTLGQFTAADAHAVERSLRTWLGLSGTS